ncbi:Crp/Fnr family transcriptional regulator [Sporosarcina oncorhynchi]|uniref:Crp/Fnr family transcriptional regulator n=1 Tax=Sporosarcina oncorhynchi TaxID=3056444 RepID=A0ABZ0L8S3_9BACL|nr:Crp/Fnr family transcriptional regulator [Sporosarcina sp. T2O-4]WOV88942.1 Crp/Fnr family transcriptional regulator [Sporosarcina sp. T2O-4]
MDNIESILKNTMFFRDLSNQELTLFLPILNKKKLLDKTNLFLQGDPITNVYIATAGKIKIFRHDPSGKEQVLHFKQVGDLFPHVGFFRRGQYPANAQAIEDSEVYTVSIKDFEQVLLDNPSLFIKLFRVLGDQIVNLQQRLEEMALRSANERILLLLVRLCETHGTIVKDGWIKLNTRFKNADLANMIGTTRESVNRMISHLRKEDAVIIEDGEYLVYVDKIKDELLNII